MNSDDNMKELQWWNKGICERRGISGNDKQPHIDDVKVK